ncbi:putative vacuolar cation channel [Phaeomoniella chlamydospora]|uniref:Putative vacuolar cation channel n=1 Tax=Phaeomoniella chlamydospora TaxID=158046 RepID=A0A0G2GZA9_PHACM|nr:putative vacuolar cation channel [Phaeomoniella chlamydospora]
MVKWSQLWSSSERDARHYRDETQRLLPSHRQEPPPSAFPPKEVTKVALRLKYQIEQVIPCELEEERITRANSPVITQKVLKTAKEAGGSEYQACVVYCLLVCKRWFKRQAHLELWDADLHEVRAVACEVIAKKLIEAEEDEVHLLQDILLKRYATVRDGEDTEPTNVIERAVDLHALRVIGSSGYQKCVGYLWKGWLHQDDTDPAQFVDYKEKGNTSYWAHLNPDRAINTINEDGDLDIVEGVLYVMTFSFICDEIAKFWKIGRYYFGFWNAFNNTLYSLLTISFILRMIALGASSDPDNQRRSDFNKLSYRFFAFSAPMFWMRLLLYLDTVRFFGAMLVVLKVMMKESLIFFALLIVVIIGFLQAFIGLDSVDKAENVTGFILQAMTNSILQSPDFDGFDNFSQPFGIILYYIFTFVVMVILLNVLIALYNSAYEDVTGNATDEYMGLFAQKTMQFVRAPDENVFLPPMNLIEMFFLILPFEWWMEEDRYARLNQYVMGVIYAPMLLITAAVETRAAHRVTYNRRRGEADDDTTEEWEQLEGEIDFEGEGWDKKVENTRPNVETDAAVLEVRELKSQVAELKKMVREMSVEPEKKDVDGASS